MTRKNNDVRDVGAWGQAIAITYRCLFLGAIAIACGWFVSNVRRIPPDSQAVVVRFGHFARVSGPGLLLALPRPFEFVQLVPASAHQIQLRIARYDEGVSRDTANATMGFDLNENPRLNAGFLLTGDSSVVHLEAQLYYQVSDADAFLIQADHVRPALQRLFLDSAISLVSTGDLDSILIARPENASKSFEAARRERFRSDLVDAVNKRLALLGSRGAPLGIIVSRVDLVPTIPRGAHDAFDSVLAVTQDSERAIAASQTNKEITAQKANGERDRIKADATAAAQENITKATVATASIAALGSNSPGMSHDMQLARLYYDRIRAILKKAGRLEIVSADGATHTLKGNAND